jgi:hypothetical protein
MRLFFGDFCMGTAMGCDPLAGTYKGTVVCDDARDPMSIELVFDADSEGVYTGQGRIGVFDCDTNRGGDSIGCLLDFSMDVRLREKTGEQELDIVYSDCTYQPVEAYTDDSGDVYPYDTPETDCRDQVEEATWDGKDTIKWKRFWTEEVVCLSKLKK